ncbi:hypothetical protein [Paenimyroides ceti]|uniref:hypothetical protein n=1 Tax=Paenimyroides ceti TaxID=395087 RepID=UPI0037C5325D
MNNFTSETYKSKNLDGKFQLADLINPEFYINLELAGHKIGIYVVLFIIFAETGLFAGFFLTRRQFAFFSRHLQC